MPKVSLRNSIQVRMTITMLAIVMVTLWTLSSYARKTLRSDMERVFGEQEFATVSLMAAELDRELLTRIKALEDVAKSSAPSMREGANAMQTLILQRPVLQSLFNDGLIAYDLNGVVVADYSLLARREKYPQMEVVAAALKDGRAGIGLPVSELGTNKLLIYMAAPIVDDGGQIVGALAGVTNLSKPNFFDLIRRDKYAPGAHYAVILPQHRMMMTEADKVWSMEMLPAAGVNPPLDRFIQDYEGYTIFDDSEAGEVLAAAKHIPATGWKLALKIPTAQALSPIYAMQQRMLLATVLLTLMAGWLVWWSIQNQLLPMLDAAKKLATMPDATPSTEMQALPIVRDDEIGQLIAGFNRLINISAQREEALKQSEGKLLTILENTEACIYLKDLDGCYLFANRPLREFFGVAMEQIVGCDDAVFFDAASATMLRDNDRPVFQHGKVIRAEETSLFLKNGISATFISTKLPLRNDAGEIYALCGISTDISERKQAEEALRIAAISFECQEGILVLNEDLMILRVNQALTRITGYSQQYLQGKSINILRSDLQDSSFYYAIWSDVRQFGGWQGEMWLNNKNQENYYAQGTITAVKNKLEQITHYVCNLIDITEKKRQEEQRLSNELAHRDILVREVHHRIKNNLQGITGMLRQASEKHPEIADPINQAIAQVQSISVIHGLQGRAVKSSVRLCELSGAIANEIQDLWQTPVLLNIPAVWTACIIAESEAVPIALVLNELIQNAVKHGGKAHGYVHISFQKKSAPDIVQIEIVNAGQLRSDYLSPQIPYSGLQLVAALLPRRGASLSQVQRDDLVVTTLKLEPPIISLEGTLIA
jgi:PAS domain S-box-containing protein